MLGEILQDFGIAVGAGLIAGVFSATIVLRAKQINRQREEVRVLRALMALCEGRLDIPVLERKAAQRAMIDDYIPVIERLRRKEEILPYPSNPGYYVLTPEGRERATENHSWRSKIFGS